MDHVPGMMWPCMVMRRQFLSVQLVFYLIQAYNDAGLKRVQGFQHSEATGAPAPRGRPAAGAARAPRAAPAYSAIARALALERNSLDRHDRSSIDTIVSIDNA